MFLEKNCLYYKCRPLIANLHSILKASGFKRRHVQRASYWNCIRRLRLQTLKTTPCLAPPPPHPLLGNIQKSEARDTRCIYCVVDKSLAPWVTHFQSESERRIEDLINKPNPG